MERSFKPLTDPEVARVRDQVTRAHEFARRYVPVADDGAIDLEVLDRAFQAYLKRGAEPIEANAVVLTIGAAFGSALVADLGFAWGITTDEWGTDLAVLALPGWGDVTIVPAEFVAKRYERREASFLVGACDEVRRALEEIASEFKKSDDLALGCHEGGSGA